MAFYGRVVLLRGSIGQDGVGDLFDHVRCDVPAAVGYGGAEVGYLQRCGQDFPLTDRY